MTCVLPLFRSAAYFVAVALLSAGCDGGSVDADTAEEVCADAGVVSWENFGDALLGEHCQGCHASTSPNRFGAPETVTFDTHAQAITWKDAILRAATGDVPTMPPAITIGATDRELLWIWLTCYED